MRQHGRHLRADPYELDMGNAAEAAQYPVKALIAQREGIAA